MGLMVLPGTGHAFDGNIFQDGTSQLYPGGGTTVFSGQPQALGQLGCRLSYENRSGTSYIRIGNYLNAAATRKSITAEEFASNSRVSSGSNGFAAITAADIDTLCDGNGTSARISDVTIVSQTSPNGTSFANASYQGIVFRGWQAGNQFEWEIAFSGATGTRLINRSTNLTPVSWTLSGAASDPNQTVNRPYDYTVNFGVTEGSGTTSTDITVTATFPASLQINSATSQFGSQLNCTVSGQTVTCIKRTGVFFDQGGNEFTVNVTPTSTAPVAPVFNISGGAPEAAPVTASAPSVTPAPAVSTTLQRTSNPMIQGVSYAIMPALASGGTAPRIWSVSPPLPAGLLLNTSTGEIRGTPTTTSAATNYTITVTDARGSSDSEVFSINVEPPYPPVVTSLLPFSGDSRIPHTIQIRGVRFTGATAVYVDSTSVPFTVVDDGTITTTISGAGNTIAEIVVETAGGRSATDRVENNFLFFLANVVYYITPQNTEQIAGRGFSYTLTPYATDGYAIATNYVRIESGTTYVPSSVSGRGWTCGLRLTVWTCSTEEDFWFRTAGNEH